MEFKTEGAKQEKGGKTHLYLALFISSDPCILLFLYPRISESFRSLSHASSKTFSVEHKVKYLRNSPRTTPNLNFIE